MNLNNVTLIGRVAGDPIFTAATNEKKTNARFFFRLAVNRIQGEQADYIPCTAWGRNAEAAQKFVSKGKELGIAGELRTSSKQLEDGTYKNDWNVSITKLSYGADSKKKTQVADAAPAAGDEDVKALAARLAAEAKAKDAPAPNFVDTLIKELLAAGLSQEEAEQVATAEELKRDKAKPAAAPAEAKAGNSEDAPF